MMPGEVKGWAAFVGRRYKTARFHSVRFRNRDYEGAGRIQKPWVEDLLINVYPDLPEVGHPLTLECLSDAYRRMSGRVIIYAAKCRVGYRLGRIATTGFYRPPGTTWGEGKFCDPKGVIDTSDDFGHWRMAVDISLAQTAETFTPNLKRSSVLLCLRRAGLIAPFSDEPWHWRPKRSLRRKFNKEHPEYAV